MERKTTHLIYFAGNGICLFFSLLLLFCTDLNDNMWIVPPPYGKWVELAVLISGLAFCFAYMKKVKIDLIAMFSLVFYLVVALTFLPGESFF